MSRYYEDFEVEQKLPTYSRTMNEADLSWFCAFVGYHVPLFIDEECAKQTRYGGRIIPSGMIMSISTGMTELLFRTSVLAQLGVERGRFLAPVRIGDAITTEVEVISKRPNSKPRQGAVVVRDRLTNQHGRIVCEIDKIVLIAIRPDDSPQATTNAAAPARSNKRRTQRKRGSRQ